MLLINIPSFIPLTYLQVLVLLGVVIYSFVDEREDMINKYISNLSNIKAKSKTEILLKDVFTDVNTKFIKGIIISQLLAILTYKDTDEENKLSLLNATLQLGRNTINKYLYQVILKIYKSENNNLESFIYSKALSEWISKDKNKDIHELLKDDTFVSKLVILLLIRSLGFTSSL